MAKTPKFKESTNNHGLVAPGTSGQFKAENLIDRLLMIQPTAVETDIVTSAGTSDGTRAHVVVLDGPDAPYVIGDALIFQKVVQGQLRDSIGKGTKVVGRLFLDTANKRAGMNAAYKLAPPTEGDISTAGSYLDSLDPLR